MKSGMLLGAGMAVLGTGLSFATLREIPYAGGKQSGSVTITTHRGHPFPDTATLGPDTIRIGAVEVTLAWGTNQFLTVCGYKPPKVVQLRASFGMVMQSVDTSSDWVGFTAYPADGLIPVDSVTSWPEGPPDGDSVVAPGFTVYEKGQNNNCEGAEYSLEPHWNRVVFLRFGSGVDYRAKISFRSVDDTVFQGPPTFTTYQVLRSITMHYVINSNSVDLEGPPVSIRAPRPSRVRRARDNWRTMDLYSPLGVKVREPGRFEAFLPARR